MKGAAAPTSPADYHIFRLEFETPVRFGNGRGADGLDQVLMTAASDTVFAALCVEWIALYGESALAELITAVQNGQLLFSSLMPWQIAVSSPEEPEYFLPRPLLSGQASSGPRNTQLKKQLKQVPWIAATAISDYLAFVRSGAGSPEQFKTGFGQEVSWDRVHVRTGGDPQPYRVAAWQFLRGQKPDPRSRHPISREATSPMTTGLYWLVWSLQPALATAILQTLDSLGTSGIGGKTSSGLGKFIVWDDLLTGSRSGRALLAMLQDQAAPVQMLVSTVSPELPQDLAIIRHPDSRYLLVSRDGFTSSAGFCDPVTGNLLKRQRCVLLREGSCFPQRLTGRVLDLSYAGLHPVYRSGRALHVGLRI